MRAVAVRTCKGFNSVELLVRQSNRARSWDIGVSQLYTVLACLRSVIALAQAFTCSRRRFDAMSYMAYRSVPPFHLTTLTPIQVWTISTGTAASMKQHHIQSA